MEKLLKLVNIYRLALELSIKDSAEYAPGTKAVDFLVEVYVEKAKKILDKT